MNEKFTSLEEERNHFININEYQEVINMQMKYMDETYQSSLLPLPVFNMVKPTFPNAYLIHLLLSMGKFGTEQELYRSMSMKKCFELAGLIRVSTPELHLGRKYINILARRMLLEQLMYYPIGTKTLDRYLIAGYNVLCGALLEQEVYYNDMPAVLNSSLKINAELKCEELIKDRKKELIKVLKKNIGESININVNELIRVSKTNPLQWDEHVIQPWLQNISSYNEQTEALILLKSTFKMYLCGTKSHPKSVILAGGPGTGKSYVMQLGCFMASAMGLNVSMTSLLADRSMSLGGVHLHLMFKIPVSDSAMNVNRLAELTIIKFHKSPTSLYYLRQLDVLFCDEGGQMSCDIWATLDIVLRTIRESSLYMGGILIVMSMDPEQLKPIKGMPFLMSPVMLTNYVAIVLKHSVRASTDLRLQRLNNIARQYNHTNEELEEFKRIIIQHCNHVPSWESIEIGTNKLLVFGKHQATKEAERKVLERVKNSTNQYIVKRCKDMQCSKISHGDWCDASNSVSWKLNRKVKEPEEFTFYKKAMVQVTFNKPGRWSQSQLGVILELPSHEQLDQWKPVKIMLAPPGVKNISSNVITKENLIDNGWKEESIGVAPSIEYHINHDLVGKRKQYGLKNYIASTIHSIMGDTLSNIVTCVNEKESKYNIWEKAQGIVLLSRTSSTRSMTFVGDKMTTAESLVALIKKKNNYSVYMSRVLNVLDMRRISESSIYHINLVDNPYRPIDVELPSSSTGYIYLIFSMKEYQAMHIGAVMNLRKRLRAHNEGYRTGLGTEN